MVREGEKASLMTSGPASTPPPDSAHPSMKQSTLYREVGLGSSQPWRVTAETHSVAQSSKQALASEFGKRLTPSGTSLLSGLGYFTSGGVSSFHNVSWDFRKKLQFQDQS